MRQQGLNQTRFDDELHTSTLSSNFISADRYAGTFTVVGLVMNVVRHLKTEKLNARN